MKFTATAVCAFLVFLPVADIEATQPPRLHLEASQGVVLNNEAVISWADTQGRFKAVVPEIGKPPRLVRDTAQLNGQPFVSFAPLDLLAIRAAVLPADVQEMTIVGVARTEAIEGGVGIFSVRGPRSHAPVVQLDCDAQACGRFIVRDAAARAASSSSGQHHTGIWGVWVGVLRKTSDGQSVAQVFFNKAEGAPAKAALSGTLAGTDNWIGGLPLGRHLLSWSGGIAEVLVYDRALPDSERVELARSLCKKYGLDYDKTGRPPSKATYPWSTEPKPATRDISTDVCVVGAGFGGIGTALAAGRAGVDVLLVDRMKMVGGTGTNALVNNWEPGPGCDFAREIYDEVRKVPNSMGVPIHARWITSDDDLYDRTTRRAGLPPREFRSMPYKPKEMDRACRDLLKRTGRVTIMDETTFFYATTNDAKSRIESILVEDKAGTVTKITAKIFVDSTGCVHLCRAVGCDVMLGVDPKSLFNEPTAPEKGHLQLNAISRCYALRRSDKPRREPKVHPPVSIPRTGYPYGWVDGPRYVNPLPMLPGRALIDYGYDKCMEITERQVRAHWRWLQEKTADLKDYELDYPAPMLGIRESYRVMTEYVLREQDLRQCLPGQKHDDIIAVADHPCDTHGSGGGGLGYVHNAYGIPYRCLIPKGDWENLLVACRGAGFSHIAASSCRLQRTMLQLGHAAGAAAAMAVKADVGVEEIDVDALVKRLDAPSRYAWIEENEKIRRRPK